MAEFRLSTGALNDIINGYLMMRGVLTDRLTSASLPL
jgi:hypothetical protein